jgi:hypothetical protein
VPGSASGFLRRCCILAAVFTLALSASAPAALCIGDECQGPAPAPEDPTPGTAVVVGPANPPVPAPKGKPGKKKPHHKQRKSGKSRR